MDPKHEHVQSPAIEIDLQLGDVYPTHATGCAAAGYAFRSLQRGTNLLPYLDRHDRVADSACTGACRASTAR
jgi:hypothetical protein